MAIIDIVLIVILAIFAIIGCCRGFLKTLFGMIGNIGSAVLAIVLAKSFSVFLNSIFNMIEFFSGKIVPAISQGISTALSGVTDLTSATVKTALNSAGGIIKYLQYFLADGATYSDATAVSTELGTTLAGIISIAISAVVLYILIRIALALLSKLFDVITKAPIISGLNRILGLALGLAQGALIIALLFALIYFLRGIPAVANVVDGVIANSTVTLWGYNQVGALLTNWLGTIDFNTLIQQIFGRTPITPAP